jgi:ankyrin repeat protein
MTKHPLPLHEIARLEAKQKIAPREIEKLVLELFTTGIDIHQTDKNGDTAFNIAAPASPIIGRLMTNFWLSGKSSKGLNEKSGSHNSSLAQYIAKWSNAQEIDLQLDDGIKKGMNIAVQNASGWTPLHAACAMVSRLHAVRAFASRYDDLQLNLKTSESYKTQYFESPEIIFYDENLTALEVAKARLNQAKTLAPEFKQQFEEYISYLSSR